MKKSKVYLHEVGSAERVVAHAAWQRSRGRKPSMSFIGEKNPLRALVLATSVVERSKFSGLLVSVGARFVRGRTYEEMNDDEIKIAAAAIICTSSSEEEVHRRMVEEIEYPYGVTLTTSVPDDEIGREARELFRGSGGMVMKNGAMAMAMLHGHNGTIRL